MTVAVTFLLSLLWGAICGGLRISLLAKLALACAGAIFIAYTAAAAGAAP